MLSFLNYVGAHMNQRLSIVLDRNKSTVLVYSEVDMLTFWGGPCIGLSDQSIDASSKLAIVQKYSRKMNRW